MAESEFHVSSIEFDDTFEVLGWISTYLEEKRGVKGSLNMQMNTLHLVALSAVVCAKATDDIMCDGQTPRDRLAKIVTHAFNIIEASSVDEAERIMSEAITNEILRRGRK